MEPILKKIQADPTPAKDVRFDIQVYVTRAKEESPLYRCGKPKFPDILEQSQRPKDGAGREWRIGVLACGPEPMVVEVQKLSMQRQLDFHKEIFAF